MPLNNSALKVGLKILHIKQSLQKLEYSLIYESFATAQKLIDNVKFELVLSRNDFIEKCMTKITENSYEFPTLTLNGSRLV